MLSNGATNSYTWDRANRLIEWDNGVTADLTAYAYDGLGNRISQSLGTTSPTVTNYLLDLQPGLAVVLAETTGAMVIRNVHAPRGIHAHKDASGAWEWMVQDGLGSVRGVVDNTVNVLESRNYDPYGESFGVTGSSQTAYGFTGEQTDNNGLLYLRARYYNSAAGVFTALDPFEGFWHEPMSINGYGYVHGNPVNFTDPSGMWPCPDCVTPVQPILTENPILSIQQDEWEVPNVVWGDYSPEDLIGLAEWCNNGSCDDQFNGIIFIPGILPSNQIPPEQIEQLRQLCDNNVMWACYSLALALSPRCKSGDRAACREIADLCNRLGNGYAGVENQNKRLCDRLLRTTCDEETYQQLYNDYKDACYGTSACDPSEPCEVLLAKAIGNLACVDARLNHHNRCLGGAPDGSHETVITRKAQNLDDCVSYYLARSCPRHKLEEAGIQSNIIELGIPITA